MTQTDAAVTSRLHQLEQQKFELLKQAQHRVAEVDRLKGTLSSAGIMTDADKRR